MLFCVVKIKKENLEAFKERTNPDDYRDDVQWIINDLLIDETSVRNYPRAMREAGGLTIGFSVDIFDKNLFTDELYGNVLDEYISNWLIERFDPDFDYDDLKICHVDERGEIEVRKFLTDNGFDYEMLLM